MATREVEANVVDNTDESRYEMFVDGEQIGFLDYHLSPGHMVLAYVEILPRFGGGGLGGRLTEAVLDDCRARSLTVAPECPFIARYIREHPEYQDLLPQRS